LKEKGLKQPQKKKSTTRKGLEEQRAYNRQAQVKSRERRSSQKTRRVKEYDRARHASDHNVHVTTFEPETPPHKSNDSDTSIFKTPAAKRKSLSHARLATPHSPRKYAATVQGRIDTATPHKRKALDNIGLGQHSPKKLRLMEETFCAVRSSLDRLKKLSKGLHRKKRRTSVRSLAEQHSDVNTAKKCLVLITKFIFNCLASDEDKKRTRRDTVIHRTVQKVQEFYRREDVSVTLPYSKTVKGGESRHILIKTVDKTYEDFKLENPELKIGRSKFAALRPVNVKNQTTHALNQCLCEYCANMDLKVRAIHKICIMTKKIR
jgi:hypothetical protein